MSQKLKEDARPLWVDFVYFSIVSIFFQEGSLDEAFFDVGPHFKLGRLDPK